MQRKSHKKVFSNESIATKRTRLRRKEKKLEHRALIYTPNTFGLLSHKTITAKRLKNGRRVE